MPNLIDYLVFRAKLDPKSIALQGVGRQFTFEQLLRVAKKTGGKLRQLGVKPGQLVVTSIPDGYVDWIVTLGLFHEAAITCSNHGHAALDSSFDYDWMITDRMVDHFPADKTIQIDTDWLKGLRNLSQEIDQMDYPSDQSLIRICLTSGTTGQRKAVGLDINRTVARVKHGAALGSSSNRISLIKLSSAANFNAAVTCLMAGSPLYCANSNREAVDLIRQFSIETLHGSPNQIGSLIQHLVARNQTLDCLGTVRCAGGALTPNLIKSIEAHLCKNVYNPYGSTEAGGACVFKASSNSDSSSHGLPEPDAKIQVVDEFDNPLPAGEDGLVRIQTAYMVHEYYKNPEASAQSFKQGWFYPGDRGSLTKEGRLVLAGRNSELINRGGVKIDPADIDQFLTGYPGIEDAAAFGIEDKLGVQQLAVAIVMSETVDLKVLKAALMKKFGVARCPSVFLRMKQIPRNQMGKVMRADIGKKFAESAKKKLDESRPTLND